MTTKQGIIASPRLSELGQVNRCTWSITVPPGSRLKFILLLYKVNWTMPYRNSQVVLFDGNSTTNDVLERLCNVKSNTTIYSRGRHMKVDMLVPNDGNHIDFLAAYEAVGLDKGNSYSKISRKFFSVISRT